MGKKFRVTNLSDKKDFRKKGASQLCLPGKHSPLLPGKSMILEQEDFNSAFLRFVKKNDWVKLEEIVDEVKKVSDPLKKKDKKEEPVVLQPEVEKQEEVILEKEVKKEVEPERKKKRKVTDEVEVTEVPEVSEVVEETKEV